VAFVAFSMFRKPDGAARSVHDAATGIASVADSLATFVNELA
jgi:hypothetical protein